MTDVNVNFESPTMTVSGSVQTEPVQVKCESIKKDRSENTNYKKHYETIMTALAELEITLHEGMLRRPNELKTTTPDAVGAVISHLSKKQLPPIQQGIITHNINEWINAENRRLFAELVGKIKYNPTAPNRWDELMEVAFGKNDDCDRWTLKHQIWLIKRRILGLEVTEKHRPLFFNIYGEGDQGKTLFFNAYLLSPLPKSLVKEVNDMALYMDERHYDIYGANLAIIFTETGKGEKVNVEQFKNIIDRPTYTRRNLGSNGFSTFKGNATLFSTSNNRLRDFIKEEKPRKWYEATFPTRTGEQIQEYIIKRDTIPVLELWQCINENEPSELMKVEHWDRVLGRIRETCGYVPLVEKWILQYVNEAGESIVGKVVGLWQSYTEMVKSGGKAEYAVNADKFKAKAEDLGFTYARTMKARGYMLSREGFEKIQHRYRLVFGADAVDVDKKPLNVEAGTDEF